MILDIKKLGDEVLRQIAEPVDLDVEFESTVSLIKNMIETVKTTDHGVGLAAPQVGISKRIIVIKDLDTNEFFPMINPVITWTSFDKENSQEGCLSVVDENNNPIHDNVLRFTRIKVKYQTLGGSIEETLVKNHLSSRIIQHEIDHLDGKLFIDYKTNEE